MVMPSGTEFIPKIEDEKAHLKSYEFLENFTLENVVIINLSDLIAEDMLLDEKIYSKEDADDTFNELVEDIFFGDDEKDIPYCVSYKCDTNPNYYAGISVGLAPGCDCMGVAFIFTYKNNILTDCLLLKCGKLPLSDNPTEIEIKSNDVSGYQNRVEIDFEAAIQTFQDILGRITYKNYGSILASKDVDILLPEENIAQFQDIAENLGVQDFLDKIMQTDFTNNLSVKEKEYVTIMKAAVTSMAATENFEFWNMVHGFHSFWEGVENNMKENNKVNIVSDAEDNRNINENIMPDPKYTNIKKEGRRLVFDDAFSIEIPDGKKFIPETDITPPMITGFLQDDSDVKQIILPMVIKESNTLRDELDRLVQENEGEAYYLILFENENVEVAVFIQAGLDFPEIECNIVPVIRVGTHSYYFQAHYNEFGGAFTDVLTEEILEFCSIFDNIRIENNGENIPTKIDEKNLDKIVCDIFELEYDEYKNNGIDPSLGEHCSEDTPVIVKDDWVITVPAGYVYSTDKDLLGYRIIVLGLDDGTLDFSLPFDSTINFSVNAFLDTGGDVGLPGLPLNHPGMTQYIRMAQESGDLCIRNDENVLVRYTLGTVERNGSGTLCISRGCILTRYNYYSFQLFDQQSKTRNEAERILKQLLLSVKTKDEYDNHKDDEKLLSDVCDLKAQIQSLKSQWEAESIRLDEEVKKMETENADSNGNKSEKKGFIGKLFGKWGKK